MTGNEGREEKHATKTSSRPRNVFVVVHCKTRKCRWAGHFQQPFENLYKRRHIVLIFRLVILFWFTARRCLNALVLKNTSVSYHPVLQLFIPHPSETLWFSSCLFKPPPQTPSLLWLVSSLKPEHRSPCLWSALLCFQLPISFTSTVNVGINYPSVWHVNSVQHHRSSSHNLLFAVTETFVYTLCVLICAQLELKKTTMCNCLLRKQGSCTHIHFC